jgi:LEA14-like dessication related protein
MKVNKQNSFLEGTTSKNPNGVALSVGSWLINLSYNMVDIASLVGDIFKCSVVMWQSKETVYILLELLKEKMEKNTNNRVRTKREGKTDESL